MPIEPILSLAFSVQAEKGAYALLLGSGVSRSAKILTGWEVTRDLIRKMAKMKGQDCEPDPEAWYKSTYGEDADYAEILKVIGKTPAARKAILRGYFEPTEEERARGEKLPTEAHRHVAELVAKGYVRIIVTTNFDHLIEDAIRAVGIEPVIISTPDGIEGAPPLSQAGPMIIKAHGDYLDARIKNTPDELNKYDERLDQFLDRIFDEFGLIVCGWSADWDTAMRQALQRCKSHRFATYWTVRGASSETTRRLITSRRAKVVRIEGADSFFSEVGQKVFALEEVARPHPLETKLAVATLKKHLADPHGEIKVHDLVMEATEHLYGLLVEKNYPISRAGAAPSPNAPEITKRLQRYEADSEVMLNLMIAGCYWGEAAQEHLWPHCLDRLANPPPGFWRSVFWLLVRPQKIPRAPTPVRRRHSRDTTRTVQNLVQPAHQRYGKGF